MNDEPPAGFPVEVTAARRREELSALCRPATYDNAARCRLDAAP